jgi:hypothetical protein
MAGHDDGDDFFSDDGLDNLPHDALTELENNAIHFTQAQHPAHLTAPPSSDYGDDFEDDDLDDAVVIDESRSTPAINPGFQRSKPGHTIQRDQLQQQRPVPSSNPNIANRQGQNAPLPPRFSQVTRLHPPVPIPQHESMVVEQGSQPSAGPDDQVESLQRQIEEVWCTYYCI